MAIQSQSPSQPVDPLHIETMKLQLAEKLGVLGFITIGMWAHPSFHTPKYLDDGLPARNSHFRY